MSPLTPDEHQYYQDQLHQAFLLADPIVKQDCPQGTVEEFAVVVAAVFEKIASPLYFLRQEREHEVVQVIKDLVQEPPKPPRRSRIYGNEETGWRTIDGQYGPFQSAREDYIHAPADKTLFDALVKEQEQSPERVYVTERGFKYWVSEYRGQWSLCRKEAKP